MNNLGPYYFVIGLVTIQALLLIVAILASARRNLLANIFLSLLLAEGAYSVCYLALFRSGLISQYSFFLETILPLAFTTGPLCLLYVQALTITDFRCRFVHVLHFLPAAAALILMRDFYGLSAPEKIVLLTNHSLASTQLPWLLLMAVHKFSYLLLSFLYLRRFQLRIRDKFSSLEQLNLKWLKSFFVMWIGLWSVGILLIVLRTPAMLDIMITARTLVIFVISFYGLRNSRIFLNVDLAGPNVPADYFTEELQASSIRERDLLQAQPRYKNSGLAAEKLQPLKAELEELFTREKIFLRSTLKVSHLAKALGVPEYQVSQIISQGFNESFYDLVNRYRIEEAKERLRSHPAPTILSVAYDVGFNSKSAFNTAFKSRTGMTPSAFMAASMPARSG